MKKYEYTEIEFFDVNLKVLGQEGWELCEIDDRTWIFKREISNKDIHIGLLTSCAYARGVANLQHRTIAEFAQFVEDVMSGNPEYKKYEFDWNSHDAIETWIEKFNEHCRELYDGIAKQITHDDVNEGR